MSSQENKTSSSIAGAHLIGWSTMDVEFLQWNLGLGPHAKDRGGRGWIRGQGRLDCFWLNQKCSYTYVWLQIFLEEHSAELSFTETCDCMFQYWTLYNAHFCIYQYMLSSLSKYPSRDHRIFLQVSYSWSDHACRMNYSQAFHWWHSDPRMAKHSTSW